MNRPIKYRAWVRQERKMRDVKLIGGGYCWLDDVWIDSKTDLNATAHEIGVTCDVMEWTARATRPSAIPGRCPALHG